ncbi:hypothetical protein ACEWY4_014881 [Coilia grayii]|uniref:Mediator of RNA polymerase II transcription subunit 26 n=1 Tax=Coilia grayii TaxID=363190 RepID=A0ABD1JTK8_9TELE
MTAASTTPQQMRDRLLQAIDGQSNIRNMIAVMEVISHLERYPITKEALEETRLGKLINDVRKKTKDEDLAKRAKKLLRTWQKLIEPGQTEPPPKENTGTNGGAFSNSPQAVTSVSGKTGPELKIRNDFHNCNHSKVEGSGHRKRKGGQKDAQHLPAKISKLSGFEHHSVSTPPPTNGIAGSPEPLSNTFDNSHIQPDKDSVDHQEHDRTSKVPVNAVKPHPSSPVVAKPPSASLLLKTAVLQQQVRRDSATTGGVQQPPKSPCSSAVNPKSSVAETLGRWPPPSGMKATVSTPPLSPNIPTDSFGSGSSLHSPNSALQGVYLEGRHARDSSYGWQADGFSGQSEGRLGSQRDSGVSVQVDGRLGSHRDSGAMHVSDGASPLEVSKPESDGATHTSEKKKKKKYRPRDQMVNLTGQQPEDSKKPAKLKDRKLTFDPVTGQIKPLVQKESQPREDTPTLTVPDAHWTKDEHKHNTAPPPPPTPQPNPLQQTNWKELSRNEIIQSYLNLQSNVLTSSGTQTPGAHFFMTEFLKREGCHSKEGRKTHVLAPQAPPLSLPGVTQEVSKEDLDRLHSGHWAGVNGCYDTKDNWHDWTECISLDPHGDEGKLHILPYVCLD